MSNVADKFMRYARFDTRSNEYSETVPSTDTQLILAKELAAELEEIGMKNVSVDENGYVVATLPSNVDRDVPTVGFIAHIDTSPEMSGTNVIPTVVENYDGGNILLNKEHSIILSPRDFPELADYVGQTLITTDGTTLLGADDKAGIAEIMTAMEQLIDHPEIEHGTVRVAFTPDEEIARGTDHFNVQTFNADFAYTLDGGTMGELEYENFNAAGAKIRIHGRNVHPGSAKGIMVNSMFIAGELMAMFPADETPATTAGYEGFYHLTALQGNVEETKLDYIIRDFDEQQFAERKKFMGTVIKDINSKYGSGTAEVHMTNQYSNMKEQILPVRYIVDIAFAAMQSLGIEPKVQPIRGGTDGAMLSFKGLPTPNIFTGGHNFHGKYEYIPVDSMEKAVAVVLKIIELCGKRQR